MYTLGVVAEVRRLVKQGKEKGGRIVICETIAAAFLAAGIAWYDHALPDHAGISPWNRSRCGVMGVDVHAHGDEILDVGFSWQKAADATAFECPPEPWCAEAATVNTDIVKFSAGLIPPLTHLRLLSIGGGHTNAFLRAVNARCPTPIVRLQDEQGRLDPEALSAGRPAFKDALAKGLKWLVIHWRAAFIFEGIAEFWQGALNIKVGNRPSEIEIMMYIGNSIKAHAAAGSDPIPYAQIESSAAANKPPCGPWIKHLSKYVQLVPLDMLSELADFAKAFACESKPGGAQKTLGSQFMAKLSGLQFGPGEKFPCVLNATIELQLSSPASRMEDGVCKLLNPASVGSLQAKDKRAKIAQAEELMMQGRTLLASTGLARDQVVKLQGQLDVRLVAFILKKEKDLGRVAAADMSEIAEAP